MNAYTGWNALIEPLPLAHILQTEQWAEIKARYGWQPHFLFWDQSGNLNEYAPGANGTAQAAARAAALVLQRESARLRVMYAPKGPLLDWGDAALRDRVLEDLHRFARKQRAIFIKIDPDVLTGLGIPGQPGTVEDSQGLAITKALQAAGWHFSAEQIQFRNTVQVDLTRTPEELLAAMKQKTRYNVRLAERRGVSVRAGELEDLDLLYHMYAETSVRDGFVIRDPAYYQQVWATMMSAGLAEPLIAEVEGQEVGAVMIFRFAGKAWYFYGMSRDAHREKMFTYLLQWEAMRRAQAAGCQVYDFWGAPDDFNEQDAMWGVYRFKEGFGGQVVRTLGAWDLPVNPLLYRLYTQVLPRLLDILRRQGRQRTQQTLMNG